MTAIANPKTFMDLSQDTAKDPFGTLTTAAKQKAYEKIYVHFNTDHTKGALPEPAEILAEVTHIFQAEPIGRIAFFLNTADGYKLKTAHGLRKYQSRALPVTTYARQELAYLGAARQGRSPLSHRTLNMFNLIDSFKVLLPQRHKATMLLYLEEKDDLVLKLLFTRIVRWTDGRYVPTIGVLCHTGPYLLCILDYLVLCQRKHTRGLDYFTACSSIGFFLWRRVV